MYLKSWTGRITLKSWCWWENTFFETQQHWKYIQTFIIHHIDGILYSEYKEERSHKMSFPTRICEYWGALLSKHWGPDNMAAISQTTFSRAFPWMKMHEFRLKFDWNLFLIDNIPSLVQIKAWRRPGDKPLSEPMLVSLLTHICVLRPQWAQRVRLS